jgi:hypothetical protein
MRRKVVIAKSHSDDVRLTPFLQTADIRPLPHLAPVINNEAVLHRDHHQKIPKGLGKDTTRSPTNTPKACWPEGAL